MEPADGAAVLGAGLPGIVTAKARLSRNHWQQDGKCSWLWSLRYPVPSGKGSWCCHGQCTEPSCCHPQPAAPVLCSNRFCSFCPARAPRARLGKVVAQGRGLGSRGCGQAGRSKRGFASPGPALVVWVRTGNRLADAGASPGSRTWLGTRPGWQCHSCEPEEQTPARGCPSPGLLRAWHVGEAGSGRPEGKGCASVLSQSIC